MRELFCVYVSLFLLSFVVYIRLPTAKLDQRFQYDHILKVRSDWVNCATAKFSAIKENQVFDRIGRIYRACTHGRFGRPFETVTDGRRVMSFLDFKKEITENVPDSSHRLYHDRKCSVVFAKNDDDLGLELAFKEKYPHCQVVKIGKDVDTEDDLTVRKLQGTLSLREDRPRSNPDEINLQGLMSLILETDHIDALYLDESHSSRDFSVIGSEFTRMFRYPVCQTTFAVKRPKTVVENQEFLHFVRFTLLIGSFTPVTVHRVDENLIEVTVIKQGETFCSRAFLATYFRQ